jgi:glutathione S-transferase|tara:strand:+ start:559 stop:912 length:354 start_codon:yes stop_codon:yes gene_type:complete
MKLELFNGPTSPFGRMTKVAGIELGLDFKETVIDVYNATFLDQWNPLRQIPTLLVDDTQPIFDSLNICLFFDSLSTTNTLFRRKTFCKKLGLHLLKELWRLDYPDKWRSSDLIMKKA